MLAGTQHGVPLPDGAANWGSLIIHDPAAPHPVHTPTLLIGNGSGSVHERKAAASPSRPTVII